MKKILVVDDHTQLRQLIEVALAGRDRRILHAESGEEAFTVARRELPDLVLLDIMLPGGIDGLEVARRLREDTQTADCAIIAVTAKAQQLDRLEAEQAGVDDYLTKPFTLAQLRGRVDELIGGH